eukprot:1874999-Rhodomonas_salina.1
MSAAVGTASVFCLVLRHYHVWYGISAECDVHVIAASAALGTASVVLRQPVCAVLIAVLRQCVWY